MPLLHEPIHAVTVIVKLPPVPPVSQHESLVTTLTNVTENGEHVLLDSTASDPLVEQRLLLMLITRPVSLNWLVPLSQYMLIVIDSVQDADGAADVQDQFPVPLL